MTDKTWRCPKCNLMGIEGETCPSCGYKFDNVLDSSKIKKNRWAVKQKIRKINSFDKEMETKIKYWQSKLIDLSRRNNLVSYRFTKSKSIQLEYPDLEHTIKDIHNKSVIRFHRKGNEEEKIENTSKYWVSIEDDKTTNKKLQNLYLKARENFQELGINTCFIGIGFLHYKNSEWTDYYNQAPILMCPIEIERTRNIPSNHHRFKIYPDFAEIHVNPALIEKLSSEWGIYLKILGENESPLDYFTYLEEEISSLEDWHIENKVIIDIFSYQKFIMYQDLKKNQSHIKSNPLIRAYIGDPDALREFHQDILLSNFDDTTDIDVLKADSSQKKAIELAKAGVTFVLQGPPGTGKSQTIVNIIAALLKQNKKILFVSQKKAALDVVLKRLKELGLDRYTLNLHTYRGNKKEIVNQLVKELETNQEIPKKYMQYSPSNYLSTQKKINEYYKYICEPREIRGLSIYDVRGKIAKYLEIPMLDFKLSSSLKLNNDEYQKILSHLEQIDSVFSVVPDPLNNIYFNFNKNKNTILEKQKYERLLNSVYELIKNLLLDCEKLKTNFDLNLSTVSDIKNFVEIHNTIHKMDLPEVLLSEDFYETWKALRKITKYYFKKSDLYNNLLEKVRADFISDDTEDLKNTLINTSFLDKIIKSNYRSAKKILDSYSKTKLEETEWIQLFTIKAEYLKTCASLENLLENNFELSIALGDLNPTVLTKFEQYCIKINEVLEKYSLVRGIRLIKYMVDNESILSYSIEEEFDINKLNEYFICTKLVNDSDPLIEVRSRLEKAIDSYEDLDDILLFKDIYNQLSDELQEFIQKYLESDIFEPVAKVFEKTYYVHVLDKYEKKEKKRPPKKLIPILRENDFEVRNAKRYQIISAVQSNKPSFILNGFGTSEVNILRREHKKKRRLMPIRLLLQKINNLVFKLKPCFMMSPLTVSQYIDYGAIHFDVVIFDEASQIMPEDAVSCLLRANQAIIMGDTQQLPPTSFFIRDFDDEEFEEEIIDLDSFLNEASLKFRNESLNWHYRSKNENLIAFSNYYFYKNSLITFPNQNELDNSGVDFVYVENGIYDRGKSRTNRAEAKKVVEIYKRLIKEEKGKSIGIIAFSRSQQRAIREQFEAEGLDIEGDIEETEKSLFIKNLETVQGDERDIIIISVGYGPDASGKLSTNFGPLNKEGGYKRLNVAVTRSRYKTIVVTSINPSLLEDDKLNTEGPRHLKNYLMYAKTKKLPTITGITSIALESDFEEAVYDALRNEGIDVVPQVGCSGYRIDLAVKHPDKPGEYILGIECDGAKYHSSKFARDRDKVRQEVLESLGWTIHRIWSEDWLVDKNREIERIKEKIEAKLSEEGSGSAAKDYKEEFEEVKVNDNIPDFDPTKKFPKYQVVEIKKVKVNLKFDQHGNLKRPYEKTQISKIIDQILEIESPMTVDLLYKRINSTIGVGRMGTRIKSLYDNILKNKTRKSSEQSVYLNGETVSNRPIPKLIPIRLSTEEDRPFLSIPIEELASAALFIIENAGAISEEDLFKNITRFFYGNIRLGKKVVNRMAKAVRHLSSNGYIEVTSDGLLIKANN